MSHLRAADANQSTSLRQSLCLHAVWQHAAIPVALWVPFSDRKREAACCLSGKYLPDLGCTIQLSSSLLPWHGQKLPWELQNA